MTTARGANTQLLLIEEATWGTTPAVPSGYKIPVTGIGGSWFSRNLVDNPELRGNRNPPAPCQGNVAVNGSFQSTIHLDAIGWILKHGVGTPVTTGAADPYTHISKVGFSGATAGVLPVGLSIEIGHTDIDQYLVYSGCKINTIGISASSEGISTFDVGIIGKGEPAVDTSSEDAAPTEYTSDALCAFSASIAEGGSPSAIITQVDLTLNNGLDDSLRTIGSSGEIVDLPETLASVTGSLTALFQDMTLLDKGLDHTESDLTLTWTSGTHSLALHIPELVYEPSSPAISGPAGVMVNMNFRAYYADDADATILKSTLINAVASY